jgi:hydroxyacylglutathione hydrolase
VLITEPGHKSEATLRLGRIGFDQVAGYLAGGLDALATRPELTRQTERMTPLTLAAALASADPPPSQHASERMVLQEKPACESILG